MSLRKTADMKAPHATFVMGGTFRVLKVNQPSKSPTDPYSTWMVAAQTPATFGGWDMGDTYAHEILRFGRLVESTEEFDEYMRRHGL